MVVGQKIKHYRKQAGLTQEQFAFSVGVHYQSVSRWERGLSMPDISQFDSISKILNVTIEDLFDYPHKNSIIGDNFSAEKMGRALKLLRTKDGLNQKTFASLFDSTSDTVSKWERGIISPPVETLVKIASYFNVALSAIYYGDVNGSPSTKTDNEIASVRQKKNKTLKIFASVCIAVLIVASVFVFHLLKNLEPNSTYNVTCVSPIENGVVEHSHDEFFHNITANSYYPHSGVCILADENTNVITSFTGTITDINNDDLLLCPYIVVKNEYFEAVYHFVNIKGNLCVGDEVKYGQILGTVCGAVGENYKIGPHIRFEMFDVKTGKAVNPADYITFAE